MGISAAFRQATIAICIYISAYLLLTALAIRMNFIHLFDYNYYFLQFWIFYNLFFSGMLLWVMYRTMKEIRTRQVTNSKESSPSSLMVWELKTAGVYGLLLIALFLGIVYL
jgi:hypothetical protein